VPTPLPVISNGFRIAHRYHSADASFVNVFWVVAAASATTSTIATGFRNAYQNIGSSFAMINLQSSDITYDATDITPLDGVTPTDPIAYPSTTHGSAGAGMAAANAALVITWLTGARGRNNRGRSYIAGIPQAGIETGSGRWSGATIADALDAASGFINGLFIQTPSMDLVVVSQHSVHGPGHRAVTDWTPRAGIGTQRRRTERNKP